MVYPMLLNATLLYVVLLFVLVFLFGDNIPSPIAFLILKVVTFKYSFTSSSLFLASFILSNTLNNAS